MKDEFAGSHPTVNFIFYIAVIVFAILQLQPGFIAVSFLCATVYFFMLKKTAGIKYYIGVWVVMILSSIINPLFSHKGATLLFYLPTGNPVTTESIIFGICAGAMIGTVLLWLSTMSEVITTDKVLALVGGVIPTMAMLLSIVFRFVPKYISQMKKTKEVNDEGRSKIRTAAHVFSITTTWALENSVDTADSMRARGYGTGRRTNYTNYRFTIRDLILIIWIAIMMAVFIFEMATSRVGISFYPTIVMRESVITYIVYIGLCITPIAINIKERLRWHILKSKI